MTPKSELIIQLRKEGKRYEEIAESCGYTLKSVREVCQTYKYTYGDIEKPMWRERLSELRQSDFDYTEIAEMFNVTKDFVENYCRREGLTYKDLGNKNHHPSYQQLAGRACIDWEQKIKEASNEKLSLVSRKMKDHESLLTVICLDCGTTKEVNAVTIRTKGRIICDKCRRDKLERERKLKKELDRLEREKRKELDRIKKLKQAVLPFCAKCGTLVPFGVKVCEGCKKETIRNCYRRKDLNRRVREKSRADKDITLEKLYRKDDGVCYLCGKTCNWGDFQMVNGVFIVGRSYPTIEHVFPLYAGGTHTWDNIKLACFACNTKKGRKLTPRW